MSPLANSYLAADQLDRMEPFYPLHAYVCSNCFLVQLQEFETPEHIFTDYAYFSSFSDSFVAHAKAYVEDMVTRFGFDETSQVIEIASNDGYLLQFFVAKNVPVLGIEPAANVAKAAEEKGIPTLVQFFNPETATSLSEQGKQADLLLGNNVLAHVPALNEFVRGMKIALKPRGIITMEFPHLLRLMQDNLFDTIYHEHFSYLSLYTVERVFAEHGLRVFDVQEVSTHGGSLRIFATHAENDERPTEPNVGAVKTAESDAGLQDLDAYRAFSERVKETKRSLLRFLMDAREQGKTRRWIRRTRKGEHPAQLLRRPYRSPGLHRGSQSSQTRPLRSRGARADLRARADRRDETRLSSDLSLEPQGRDHEADGPHSGVGWEVRRTDSKHQSA